MNLDELSKLEAAMTPGPWTAVEYDGGYWKVESDGITCFDDGSACGEYGDACTSANRDGLVALRNAAPALIECARLLREIRTFAHDDPRWSDKTVRFTNHCLVNIDAALARLNAQADRAGGKDLENGK
jgi:hypothetical protein